MNYGKLCCASMLMLLVAGPVSGQFSEVTATDDGQVYFTSTLILRSSRTPASRLFPVQPIGIYQVSARMPADAGAVPNCGAECTITPPDGDSSTLIYGFGQQP